MTAMHEIMSQSKFSSGAQLYKSNGEIDSPIIIFRIKAMHVRSWKDKHAYMYYIQFESTAATRII